jgi:transcriptional regulator with XRE-family HTH domain
MAQKRDIPARHAAALQRARSSLTVADEVGLALRAHRRQLGLSQRAYAVARGLSRAMLARLEASAGQMSLTTVSAALEGTGFRLYVGRDDTDEPPPGGSARPARLPGQPVSEPGRRVAADEWEATDLVARVRGGGRRFPAHREVRAVDNPPLWWWVHQFFSGPTEEPQWYAPVCHLDRSDSARREPDVATPHAV